MALQRGVYQNQTALIHEMNYYLGSASYKSILRMLQFGGECRNKRMANMTMDLFQYFEPEKTPAGFELVMTKLANSAMRFTEGSSVGLQ